MSADRGERRRVALPAWFLEHCTDEQLEKLPARQVWVNGVRLPRPVNHLDRTQRSVMYAAAAYMDADGRVRASFATLAGAAEVSVSTVSKVIAGERRRGGYTGLVELGWLEIVEAGRQHRAHTYIARLPGQPHNAQHTAVRSADNAQHTAGRSADQDAAGRSADDPAHRDVRPAHRDERPALRAGTPSTTPGGIEGVEGVEGEEERAHATPSADGDVATRENRAVSNAPCSLTPTPPHLAAADTFQPLPVIAELLAQDDGKYTDPNWTPF